jgi:hypothetical protein
MTTPIASAPYVPSTPALAPLPAPPGLAASFAPEADPSAAYAQDLYKASFGLAPSVTPENVTKELKNVTDSVRKQNGVFGWLYKGFDTIIARPFKAVVNFFKRLVGITPKPNAQVPAPTPTAPIPPAAPVAPTVAEPAVPPAVA